MSFIHDTYYMGHFTPGVLFSRLIYIKIKLLAKVRPTIPTAA